MAGGGLYYGMLARASHEHLVALGFALREARGEGQVDVTAARGERDVGRGAARHELEQPAVREDHLPY
eukprot:4102246-Prymnesium_polylepis.1